MKIKIEEKTENPLLNRQDITFLVEHPNSSTPTRLDIRAKLAALLNCPEDQLYVIKLHGQYGQFVTRGLAHYYSSKELALTHEQKYVLKRHTTEAAADAASAPSKKKAPIEEETEGEPEEEGEEEKAPPEE